MGRITLNLCIIMCLLNDMNENMEYTFGKVGLKNHTSLSSKSSSMGKILHEETFGCESANCFIYAKMDNFSQILHG